MGIFSYMGQNIRQMYVWDILVPMFMHKKNIIDSLIYVNIFFVESNIEKLRKYIKKSLNFGFKNSDYS